MMNEFGDVCYEKQPHRWNRTDLPFREDYDGDDSSESCEDNDHDPPLAELDGGVIQTEESPMSSSVFRGDMQDIMELVNRLSHQAAKVMVSDPVPQHLGSITLEEYEGLKQQEVKNFEKTVELDLSPRLGKKPVHDTIWVLLHKHKEECSLQEECKLDCHDLQTILIPHLTGHIEVEEKPQLTPSLTEPCPGILKNEKKPCIAANKGKKRHRVVFKDVTVRDYPMVLGDHPCCRYGPPVTLDWQYLEYEPVSLLEFEEHHFNRRPLRNLYLCKPKRQQLLLDQGYKQYQINSAARACRRAQYWREMTIALYPCWRVEHSLQSLCRKIKRLGSFHKKSPAQMWCEERAAQAH